MFGRKVESSARPCGTSRPNQSITRLRPITKSFATPHSVNLSQITNFFTRDRQACLKGTVIDLATGRQVLDRKTSLIVLLVVALLEEVEVEQHQCSGEQRLVRWGRSGWKLDHEVVCGTSRHAQPPKVAAWPLVLESSHDILRHRILNENAVRRVEARRRAAVGKSVRAAIRHDEIVDRFRAVIHHGVVKLVPVERNGRERA